MATVVGTYQYYGTQLVMNVYEEGTNYGGNYSTMRIQVYMYQPNNSKPWALDAVSSFSASLGNGAAWGYSYGYDHRAGNGATTWLVNEPYNYGHNSLGQATVAFAASSSAAVIGSASTGTGYAGTTDFQYPPATPSAGASRSADGGTITVTSSAPSSNATITDYNYRWSTDNASWSGNVGMGTGRTATFTGTTTQDYYFQTAAYSSEGWSGWSGSAFVQGVPTVPTNVVGTASSSVSGRITVTWTAPSDTNGGITNYYVYRNGAYVGQTGNANTTYIDDGLTKGTNYSYTVRAYNAIGYSALSSASTNTQAPGVPYAATLNSVTPSTDTFGKVTLSWSAPSTAVGTIQNYYMYAVFGGVIEKTVATASATTSGDITGLDERKVYTFYVRARNQFSIDNGTPGDQSNTIDKKSPGPPTAPTNLTSSAPFFPPGTIDLSWTAPSDVGTEGGTITGYSVYLAGSSTPIKTTTGTGTSTTIEDLIPATSYTFVVRARNAIADTVGTFSVASNSTTATAQGEPNAPTGLTVVSDPLVAGRLILTWEPPVGYNTGFRVYTGADVLVANIAVPRLEIDGLTPNTSYSYKVRARNPLTDLTGSPGGPASTTVSGVVGASSTQTVPSISVSNTTNNTLVGTYNLIGTTATTMSYAKTASNIPFASVPVSGGSTANNTNTNLNGTYTVTVVGTQATSTAVTYSKAGSDIAANTSTPSGTMYNNTNVIFNGNYEVLSSPAPDPVLKTVAYSKVSSDITSRAASGAITNNSNAVYNGEYVISDATETTISYAKTNADIEESDAFGMVYNKTNTDIFNGTFTLTDTPDYRTVEYSTGDLTYAENLITNPSFETVQSGSTVLRTNLITNPSFDTNVTGWTGTNASIARSADQAKYGTHSALVSPSSNTGSVGFTVTLPASGVYTFSAWVYCSEAKNVKITGGTAVSITEDTWTRISHTTGTLSGSQTFSIESVDSTVPFYVDGVMLESGSLLRPYFDGATADALGWDYGWTGTANASTSTAKALTTAVRTNLITNPSFETDLTGWTAAGFGATATRTTSQAYSGTYSAQINPGGMGGSFQFGSFTAPGTITLSPTTDYVASAWVKGATSQVISVRILQFNSSGSLLAVSSANTALTSSGWERVSATVTTQASVAYAVVQIAPPDNTTIYVDAVQLELGTTPTAYFDGSSAGASWSGTAHASTSTTGGNSAIPVGLTTVSSEITSSYVQAHSGDVSALVAPSSAAGGASVTMTTVADTVYTFSAWVYATSAKNMKLSADLTVGTTVAVPATTWTRLSLSFTAADTSTVLSILGTDSTTAFYLDDVMLQESATLSSYFDGDTDATSDTWPAVYSWSGTPHASTSIREVGGTLPAIGAELIMPYGQAARVNSKAQLQIQYRSGWIG